MISVITASEFHVGADAHTGPRFQAAPPVSLPPAEPAGQPAQQVAGAQVETEIPIIEDDANLFDRKIRTFLDAAKNGTPAPVPTSQILYNQAILSGIAESSKLGREIAIEIPEI